MILKLYSKVVHEIYADIGSVNNKMIVENNVSPCNRASKLETIIKIKKKKKEEKEKDTKIILQHKILIFRF